MRSHTSELTLHFTTSASLRSISYSLAHSNIASLLYSKLTPQMLLYLLIDTCSLKMIHSAGASIAACSGGVLDSIIKLETRDRARGWWEEESSTGQRRIIESWGSYQGRGEWAPCLTVDQRAPPAGTSTHEPSNPPGWRALYRTGIISIKNIY